MQKLMNHAEKKRDQTRWSLVSLLRIVYPQQDSNLRFRLRRPTLYPLSYEGGYRSSVAHLPAFGNQRAGALMVIPGNRAAGDCGRGDAGG